jgi:hypothetical protein
VSDDCNLPIPDVKEPTSSLWNSFPPSGVLSNADYKVDGPLNGGFYVYGKTRLWVTGNMKLTGGGTITIMPGGSFELFIGQTSGAEVTADIGGNGIVNNALVAANCRVWGLPTCVDWKYHGGSALLAAVYTPQAAITVSGTSDIYGTFTGDSFSCNGGIGIHQDQGLSPKTGNPIVIISWEEL